MPTLTYRLVGPAGEAIGNETLRGAPGMAGRRWFSTSQLEGVPGEQIADLSVDDSWRPMRVRIANAHHHLILQRAASGFAGARDQDELATGPTPAFVYPAPMFAAIMTNRLLADDLIAAGGAIETEAVAIDADTLLPTRATYRFALIGPEEVTTAPGVFDALHWRITDVASDLTSELWIAEDVVVSQPGSLELLDYDPGVGPVPR